MQVAWNAYLSWTCSGGGVAVLDLAPSDLAGAGVDDIWLVAVPCVHKLQHAGAGLASFKLLEEARQAAGFEHIIAAWGWQVREAGACRAVHSPVRRGRAPLGMGWCQQRCSPRLTANCIAGAILRQRLCPPCPLPGPALHPG